MTLLFNWVVITLFCTGFSEVVLKAESTVIASGISGKSVICDTVCVWFLTAKDPTF